MTRINLVEVEKLADQHLLAEWREMKMVPAALVRYLKTNSVQVMLKKVGLRYKLGKGHVSFFYDKMPFLTYRYELITKELLKRGVQLQTVLPFTEYTKDVPSEFIKKVWEPDDLEIAESRARIISRIAEKPEWYRYYKQTKNLQFFEQLLK